MSVEGDEWVGITSIWKVEEKGKHRKEQEMQKQPGLCTDRRQENEGNDEAELAHQEIARPCYALPALLWEA